MPGHWFATRQDPEFFDNYVSELRKGEHLETEVFDERGAATRGDGDLPVKSPRTTYSCRDLAVLSLRGRAR